MEDERKIGGTGPLGLNLISGIGGSNTIGQAGAQIVGRTMKTDPHT